MRTLVVVPACAFLLGSAFPSSTSLAEPQPVLQPQAQARVDGEYGSLFEFYQDLHTHPELSFHEVRTSKQVADKLRAAGVEVTEKVGGHGVVGAT